MSRPVPEPLRIDSVAVPRSSARLGLCACPGVRRARHGLADPGEGLRRDLQAIREFGAAGLVTLVDEAELVTLGLDTMPGILRDMGLWWMHLPITDMGVPNRLFETRWEQAGPGIHAALDRGEHVVLHCWAGLGRTGTIAARVLIERGLEPEAAVLRVRDARPGAIQTRKQEKYVLRLRPPRP